MTKTAKMRGRERNSTNKPSRASLLSGHGAETRTKPNKKDGESPPLRARYLQQQRPLGRVQLRHTGLGLDEELLGVLDVLRSTTRAQCVPRGFPHTAHPPLLCPPPAPGAAARCQAGHVEPIAALRQPRAALTATSSSGSDRLSFFRRFFTEEPTRETRLAARWSDKAPSRPAPPPGTPPRIATRPQVARRIRRPPPVPLRSPFRRPAAHRPRPPWPRRVVQPPRRERKGRPFPTAPASPRDTR